MTNTNLGDGDLKRLARQMARDGMAIKAISEELGITWERGERLYAGLVGGENTDNPSA